MWWRQACKVAQTSAVEDQFHPQNSTIIDCLDCKSEMLMRKQVSAGTALALQDLALKKVCKNARERYPKCIGHC
jgi:hypothetical protein